MIEVTAKSGDATVHASAAIVVYSMKAGYGTEREAVYATVHPVNVVDGLTQLGAGTAVSRDGLSALFRGLDPQRAERASLTPTRVLTRGANWMVWYMPPSRRRVWFKADTIGETSAEVPLPGLVFSVSPGGWRVFALRGARRPGASTKLYQAPFFNVSSTGVICVGSSQTPKGDARFDPAAWEQAFFESYFSHPNVHGSSLVHYKGGAYPFWQAMLKGKKWRESFPKEVLVERSMTLGRLIAQINQELDRG